MSNSSPNPQSEPRRTNRPTTSDVGAGDSAAPASDQIAKHIVIAGGGMVGLFTAYRLQKLFAKQLKRREVKITIIDPTSYMTYQSFLPEAGAGSLDPRQIVVPLRKVLKRVDVITGWVTGIDHEQRAVQVQPHSGEPYTLNYDELVVAVGSVSRVLPIPGLEENGIGFKTVEEAIWLRNHVLERLDAAASTGDLEVRRRALTFVFVGGGYTGVEALAELEDMARDVIRQYYKRLDPSEMRWLLVDAANRILPEVGPELGEYGVQELEARGIEVKLETTMTSAVGGHVVLSDGTEVDTDTLVWTAGVKANPVLADSTLPLTERGFVRTRPDLRVVGTDEVWAGGDMASVPDLTADDPKTATLPPNAQNASRQPNVLARNLWAKHHGRPLKLYRHKGIGSVATLGLHQGVANPYGVKLRGLPAWFMHRSYHVMKMPTFNRKVRILLNWSLALFFRREPVSLGAFARPREEFQRSMRPPRQRDPNDSRVPAGRG